MSEQDNGYYTGLDMAAGADQTVISSRQAIVCECGAPLWTEVIMQLSARDEIYIVFDHGPTCQHFSGACSGCGKRLEWHAPEQKLERLVRRRVKQRKT